MTERTLLIALTALYLLMFIGRNLIVKKRTRQPIRKADFLVSSAIIITTLCFIIAILSTLEKWYVFMGRIAFLRSPVLSYAGFILFFTSIILCWIFSSQLKDSWRVGVHETQKTTLIKNGIYAYVRNPYFVSYFIMYLSLFLIRPSIVLLVLAILVVIVFHKMVMMEEAYLLKTHGKEYEEYKAETGRYFPHIQ